MSKLHRDMLLGGLGLIVLGTFLSLVLFINWATFNNDLLLNLSLTILVIFGCIFFCYLLWVRAYGVKVLLLGDHSYDEESLIDNYEIQLLDGQRHTKIIPQVILEKDSLRTRAQLRRIRGSFFFPPRVVINLNINQLLLNDEAQQVLLTHNLNRVLHLLKRRLDEQKIDVIINSMGTQEGFYEFSNLASQPMRFSALSKLKEQFDALQNSSQALGEYPSERFLNYLKFSHNMPVFLTIIDTLLSNIMLSGYDSNCEVVFSK
ncbi:MAG: hypothetical protein ACJAV1_002155 [Paraglaciecola sp.]|jgi:hypothetical protein